MKKMITTLLCAGLAVVSTSLFAGENLLKNSDLKEGQKGWFMWADKKIKEGFKRNIKDGKLTVEVPAVENAKPWYLQFNQKIKLEVGKKYKVSIKLNAEKAGLMYCSYQLNGSPWTTIGLSKSFKVASGEKVYEAVFTAKENKSKHSAGIKFQFGRLAGKTVVSDMKLELVK